MQHRHSSCAGLGSLLPLATAGPWHLHWPGEGRWHSCSFWDVCDLRCMPQPQILSPGAGPSLPHQPWQWESRVGRAGNVPCHRGHVQALPPANSPPCDVVAPFLHQPCWLPEAARKNSPSPAVPLSLLLRRAQGCSLHKRSGNRGAHGPSEDWRYPEETWAPVGAPPSAAKPRLWEQPPVSAKIRNECQVYFRDAYFCFYVSLLQLFPIWQQQFLTLPFGAVKLVFFLESCLELTGGWGGSVRNRTQDCHSS